MYSLLKIKVMNKPLLKYSLMLISFFWIFQSCAIYHKQPRTLDEAVKSNRKVKVILTDGRKLKFDRLEIEAETIFGVQNIKGEQQKTIISKNQIEEIQIKNKGASTTVSIILGLGIFTGIMAFIAANMTYSISP